MQSNVRAEAGVKSLKWIMRGNTGPKGSLHTDNMARALLQYGNTPLRHVNKSPAELAIGRELGDTLPLPMKPYQINPHWAQVIMEHERSMSVQNEKEKFKYDVRSLSELCKGDQVLCQNTGSKKWDRSGIIVEVGKYKQYTIKMDGSGCLSLRNQQHLQKIGCNTPHLPPILPLMFTPSIPLTNVYHSY